MTDDLDEDCETSAGARSMFSPAHDHGEARLRLRLPGDRGAQRLRRRRLAPADTAVFAHEGWMVNDLMRGLAQAGVPAVEVGPQTEQAALPDRVRVMTVHRAKGLEFRALHGEQRRARTWITREAVSIHHFHGRGPARPPINH
jgi:hypothetical protein